MKKLDDKLFVAGQISENDFPQLSKSGIKVIINNRPDNEEGGQLNHEQAHTLAKQYEMEYHYLPMVNGQPLPPTLVDDFRAIIEQTEQPVLIHCRTGMRSTIIWALGEVSSGSKTIDHVIRLADSAGIKMGHIRTALEDASA